MANIIKPAAMHLLCIALRYNKPSKSKNHISILFIMLNLVLFLEFQYFELQNIFLANHKEFQYSVVSWFVDSGAGLILSMVGFSPSIH